MKAINVYPRLFGGPMRAGDLIAACNFLEYLRKDEGDDFKNLQLWVPTESIRPQHHCWDMYAELQESTNYFARYPDELVELHVLPGTDPTYGDMYNLWNIRENVLQRRQNVFDIPDAVVIPNKEPKVTNKVVIAPLLDAPYNQERNWSRKYTQELLNYYCFSSFLEVIIASKESIDFDIGHAKYSHDYDETLQHIRTCCLFHGGDTGLSHYASALQPGPNCEFHYSKNTYGTTNPFYWKTKHRMIYY